MLDALQGKGGLANLRRRRQEGCRGREGGSKPYICTWGSYILSTLASRSLLLLSDLLSALPRSLRNMLRRGGS